MHFLKKALALLSGAAAINAVALPVPEDLTNPICAGCYSCTANDNGFEVISYNVHVGLPFDGLDCLLIDNYLQDMYLSTGLTMFDCWNDDGYLTAHFNMVRDASRYINYILGVAYPEIGDNGGFNCPDY